jgi:membrane-bound lytic murein transglycosylase D
MRVTALLVLLVYGVQAQTPQVPHKMNFAGITLTIRDDARREIQKDVDALTQYPRYFNIKVERARTYFPIIEKIFAEERLPEDFKYLVIQESALIPDAVSVSDAVGFWQFKDFTAVEMGLRVDKEIDERMNIASSTRAAAQYIKKNNHYFNNWVYALQAYQMGAGGVMRSVKDYESGTKHMEITSKTYWYVKKFIAHKVAFENAVRGPGELKVLAYENQHKTSLSEIAKEVSVPQEKLQEYNKWVRRGTIPDDRKYVVAIPVQGDARNIYAAVEKANTQSIRQTDRGRRLEVKPAAASLSERKFIHGLPAIKAEAGESVSALVKRAGVNLSYFLTCNDISISDQLVAGQYYYLKKKKSKTPSSQHVVMLTDETLWSVSQQYGVQLKRLKKLNPAMPSTLLKPGTVVTLPGSGSKPDVYSEPQLATVEVQSGEYFSWSADPKTVESSITVTFEEGAITPATVQAAAAKNEVLSPANEPESAIPEVQIVQEVQLSDKHVVSAGETLYSISKMYGVGVMDLTNLNGLRLEEGIRPGQVLKVRAVSEADLTKAENFIIYEVKPLDTLYSVARQYGVTIKDLMDWNKKKDFNVSTGEKLRIQQK